jgi:hypothetical protein
MSQPLFRLSGVSLNLPYPIIYLPQFQLTNSTIWDSGGPMVLTNPGGPNGNIFASPDVMVNSTVDMLPPHPATLLGAQPIINNAWMIEEAGSTVYASNITGTGDWTNIGSNTVIASGQGATSETIAPNA